MPLARTTEIHPLYGKIEITINPRARRITLRARDGYIGITMPPRTPRKFLDEALAKHGSKLFNESCANKPQMIDGNYRFESDRFTFSLAPTDRDNFFLRIDNENATLHYPARTDFSDTTIQEWLRRVRLTALRRIASQELPQRLKELAAIHRFKYTTASLRDSHSRWGSCSTRGSISLSIYLQLLPQHLTDYVILHELCHTVEMNHSERFWALLDKVTKGEAQQLRGELRGYKTDF